MGLKQKERSIAVLSDLGEDVLLFHRMAGSEELGHCFEYELELLSAHRDLEPSDILGHPMAVRLRLPEKRERHFHGVVTSFCCAGSQGRLARYELTLRPWLWLLTRTADCRIFQQMTVPEIIQAVFHKHGLSDVEDALTGTYRSWDYCVQYRETDFNFVSRLMEQEGIYYYFKHDGQKHTLVLCDDYTAHEAVPGYEEIPLNKLGGDDPTEQDHLFEWTITQQIQAGTYALNEFDFENPKADLEVKSTIDRDHEHASFEIYDYPGEFVEPGDGEAYVRHRIEELQARFELASGSGNARGMASGCLFRLTESPRDDQNREYLIVRASHSLTNNEYESGAGGSVEYSGAVLAIDSRQPYRPERVTPKPMIRGPQTAIVVGKSGEDIWTDPHARVKLKFPWDRYSKGDESSSCWVRVAQVWAGTNWGGIHIPRIGQEVIVEHLEGDPDRPIVTGRVYNADCMPPYDLPANQTQSGIKSRSSKEGTAENFNEIRFEDKKGEELFYLHAEKDRSIVVENDDTESVGNDQSITIAKNRTESVGEDEQISIGANRTESVGDDEQISIGANRTRSVGKDESVSIGASRSHDVAKDETISIGSNHDISVSKNRSLNVGKNESVSVGDNRTQDVGKNDTLQVGKKLVIDAGDSIVIRTGNASISMKKDGTIVLKGKNITLNGSGKVGIKASGDVTIKGSKVKAN